jgi:type II secretory pathway pseudopilin PulG
METMRRSNKQSGFTLPAVLVVVAALLILAVGSLLVTGVERDTARSFVDRQRAETAARAGLEEFRGILATEAANDDYIVLQSTLIKNIPPVKMLAPHLFIARAVPDLAPDTTEKKFTYRYIPLFSTLDRPENASFKSPEIDDQITGGAGQYLEFPTLPYQDKVRAAWLPVLDNKDRMVARYAYWVEDLQARVDPTLAGNKKGPSETHLRASWPFPAPGLNGNPQSPGEPALDQIALFAVDPDATDAAQGDLGKTLIKNRAMLVSPESQLAAAAIQPPLERLSNGDLADPRAASVEKGLVAGLRSYQEQPLVPFAAGIDPAVAGEPKLNLNKLLSTAGDTTVTKMADFINEALPEFVERKGGFPEDYLKTLAANALDYADADKDPTLKEGEYRGIDAYPLVSEFLLKPRIEGVRLAAGRRYVDLSVAVYVELWNMSNVLIDRGEVEISYETKYGIKIFPNSSGNPNPAFRLDDMSKATPALGESNGYRWFPAFQVNDLRPNEYRIFPCGTVTYAFDIEDDTNEDSESALNTRVELSGDGSSSGYRLRWNGKLVDQSRGGLLRNSMNLHYRAKPEELNTMQYMQQQLRCNVPGHTYRIAADQFPNMGDSRMAYYILAPQAANAYPQNYSPYRRNIRMDSYTPDNNLVVGRVLPSEWPDSGHDSPFGTDSIHGLLGLEADAFYGDQRIDPKDSRFENQLPDLTHGKEEAPTRLSNNSRFYSVTELGRTYDPVMWQTLGGASPSLLSGSTWGSVNSSSTSSGNHGGGNTLRIGRAEHPKFDIPGLRAAHLLDLFHTGNALSEDAAQREGLLVKIQGQVNLNTASRPALRQLIAGSLGQDPEIRKFVSDTHTGGASKIPEVEKLSGSSVPDVTAVADRIAGAIMRSRPFASTGELADTRESNGTRVFGNADLFPGFGNSSYPMLQWTDSAAEETFARAHEASTVRSRNFRIWVVGQSLKPTAPGNTSPEVLSEVRKNFTVFGDPGERKPDGSPDPLKFRLRILHENDF